MTRAAIVLVAIATLIGGCGPSYSGQARSLPARALAQEPGWSFVPGLHGIRQVSEKDCGSAALASVLSYWSVDADRAELVQGIGQGRASMGQLRQLSQDRGMRAFIIPGRWDDLAHEVAQRRPVIIGLVQPYGRKALTHYEVVVGIHGNGERVATFDPARGFRVRTRRALMNEWKPARKVALIVMPSEAQS